jgi:hypothetical protein
MKQGRGSGGCQAEECGREVSDVLESCLANAIICVSQEPILPTSSTRP